MAPPFHQARYHGMGAGDRFPWRNPRTGRHGRTCESRYMVYGTLVFPARPLYYVQNRGKRAAQRQASLLEQDLKTEIFK